jgi:hypothetical protein
LSEPLIELGVQAIKAQLATITEDNGYLRDIVGPVRPGKLGAGITFENGELVIVQGDAEKPELEPSGMEDWITPFELILVSNPQEDSGEPEDQHSNRFAADVRKALLNNEDAWQFTGRINWELLGPDVMPREGPAPGVRMTLRVHHRHNYGDPFTYGG